MTGNGIGLALIAEARRLGLSLRADGDIIKVKPAEKLPPDLAERIKANRAEVLAVLRSLPTADAPRCHERDAKPADGVQGGGIPPTGNSDDLPAALAAADGGAGGAAVDSLHGGDVQPRNVDPAVRVGLGDEHFRPEQGNKVGVADGVRLSAGRDDAESLERLPVQQFMDGLSSAHADSLASRRPSLQGEGDIRPAAPVRLHLDDLDRRCLLQCGILPTPSPDDLPEPWRTGYRTHAARLVKLGVPVEQAEHIAFQETLRRMLACGDLKLPEGW